MSFNRKGFALRDTQREALFWFTGKNQSWSWLIFYFACEKCLRRQWYNKTKWRHHDRMGATAEWYFLFRWVNIWIPPVKRWSHVARSASAVCQLRRFGLSQSHCRGSEIHSVNPEIVSSKLHTLHYAANATLISYLWDRPFLRFEHWQEFRFLRGAW